MLKTELLKLDDQTFDEEAKKTVREWDEPEPTALQLLKTLDWCVRYALTTGQVIQVLNIFYERALLEENKTNEQVVALATWRNED